MCDVVYLDLMYNFFLVFILHIDNLNFKCDDYLLLKSFNIL